MSNVFKESLCGCFDDMYSCCVVFCVPFGTLCIQASAVNKAIGGGAYGPYCLVFCCGIFGAAINRGKIRVKFGIDGSCPGDYCMWCWCAPCAACQEYREAHKRG